MSKSEGCLNRLLRIGKINKRKLLLRIIIILISITSNVDLNLNVFLQASPAPSNNIGVETCLYSGHSDTLELLNMKKNITISFKANMLAFLFFQWPPALHR